MKKQARAPVRIDFGGGTTDMNPFPGSKGVVLNAAINRYVKGSLAALQNSTKLEYHADIPTSSGLGTSGVMNVVWLALTTKYIDKKKLAELAHFIERDTGVVGGKQDQYAAVYGGINFMEFNDDKVKVTRLKIRKDVLKRLESKLFLYYTGPRLSSKFNKKVFDNLKRKDKRTMDVIKKIIVNTKAMRNALQRGNLNVFAALLNNEWMLRKQLHPKITTRKIDSIIEFGKKHGASAAKVTGAGGGGCILFLAENKKALMKKLERYEKFGKEVIDFKFDMKGVQIKK
ncbi:hypothetical protein ACFLZ7_00880 [Nanoarchaeota archaeon]